MASLKSWSSGRLGRGGLGRIVRFWSSKDSFKLLRADPRRFWVSPSCGVEADDRSLSDTDIIQAERSLYRVRQDIVAKREEMGRISSHQEPSGSGSGGWMGKVFGSKADQGEFALVTPEI